MSTIAQIDKIITSLQGKSYTITIADWHPTPLNKLLRNRWQSSRLKRSDREIIAYYALHFKVPKATGKRSVQITLQLGYRGRGIDPDSPQKSTLDALVHAGLLTDDNKEGVELLPVKYLKNTKGKDGRKSTIITLTEVM